MNTFFIVWNMARKPGTFIHTTKESVQSEVDRLQRVNPDDTFVILKSVGQAKIKRKTIIEEVKIMNMDDVNPIKKFVEESRKKLRKKLIKNNEQEESSRFNSSNTWKTSGDRYILIKNLTDEHLLNIIKMLNQRARDNHRKALKIAYSLMGSIRRTVDVDRIEDDIQYMEMHGPDTLRQFPIMYNLTREKFSRSL